MHSPKTHWYIWFNLILIFYILDGVSEDMYDDLDLDEEDDGVPEDDDDEYNEITEAPRNKL